MKHFGDITKISGYDVPPVDVITGGSPCQDLSIAGKRAGLDGERSGLFMEQIRIVKEMRSRYVRIAGSNQLVRLPRYCVWENVPGAFSSNGGKDFQAVLTEFARVAEPDAPDVPMPEKGRWPKAGCIYDDLGRWSIAWRVHDAQFWGTPQRRKRIALVADFGGLSAPEILFERKGLSGNPESGREAGKGIAGATERGFRETVYGIDQQGGEGGNQKPVVHVYENHSQDSRYNPLGDICETVSAKYGTGGNNMPMVVEPLPFDTTQITSKQNGNNPHYGDPCHPLAAGAHAPAIAYAVGNGHLNQMSMAEQANTLDTMHDAQAILTFDKEMYNCGDKMTGSPQARYDDVAPTCRADSHPSGVCTSTVRRLTPDECASLQGYPRDWCNIGDWVDSKGKKHKDADSPKYKAYGNSIAVGYANRQSGFWCWMARRICAQYERQITMASLFDGIGGFPLAFSACGAVPVWASEIEEFPIAVTKYHFPEE